MNSPMILKLNVSIALIIILGLMIAGPVVREASAAFDSGSICASAPTDTNCLGDYHPLVNDVIVLPTNGILQYSSFTVPRGVTVTFQKNTNNTPVTILVSGNVTLYGTINVSGSGAACSGTACGGNLGDDGQPGLGGPGGFDGGFGGYSANFGGAGGQTGGSGKGPGGGNPGSGYTCWSTGKGGGGGGYASAADGGDGWCNIRAAGGVAYGQSTLLPLIGGSGGGGGSAGYNYSGAGGGGGGGAILIASSGTIRLGENNCGIHPDGLDYCISWDGARAWGSYGRVFANGAPGGDNRGDGNGGGGGGGSGGAIRLVAETVARGEEGYLQAAGAGWSGADSSGGGSGGAPGRIRIEANTMQWSGNTDPGYSYGTPGHVFVPSGPTLSIVSIMTGTNTSMVPANPTGNADITLPQGTATATVNLAATNIPRGTSVTVYVMPSSGAGRSTSLSHALDGASDLSTTATATVTLSPGNNVLMAAATYTVTEMIAMNLPTFDNGIRVAKVRVESTMGSKESKVIYITASGKEYAADSPLRDKPGKIKKAVEKEKKA